MKKEESKIQNKELEKEPENDFKKGFFKKVWYSITKIETYPELATEGVPRAVNYFSKLVAILAIVISLATIYQVNSVLKQCKDYLQNNFPDFTYQEGTLSVESEEPIIIEESIEKVGKIIVDVKTDSEEQINQYINEISEKGNGLIVLKNRVIMKNEAITGTASYDYKEILTQMGLTSFNKQDIIEFMNSSQMYNLYISLFITLFIYAFTMYFVNYLINVLLISLFGCIANLMTKLKMRYAAVFNMTVYAITLSTILNMIYIGVNAFISFEMPYFSVMYVTVAAIYLIAAIFMIKADVIKRQVEVMKIEEVQKEVKKEIEQKQKEKQEEKEKKRKEEKKNEKEEKSPDGKEKDDGVEPEGSNA